MFFVLFTCGEGGTKAQKYMGFFFYSRQKIKLRRIKGYCSSGTVWSPNTESVAAKLHPNTPGTVSTSNSDLIEETKRKRSIQTLQTQSQLRYVKLSKN